MNFLLVSFSGLKGLVIYSFSFLFPLVITFFLFPLVVGMLVLQSLILSTQRLYFLDLQLLIDLAQFFDTPRLCCQSSVGLSQILLLLEDDLYLLEAAFVFPVDLQPSLLLQLLDLDLQSTHPYCLSAYVLP